MRPDAGNAGQDLAGDGRLADLVQKRVERRDFRQQAIAHAEEGDDRFAETGDRFRRSCFRDELLSLARADPHSEGGVQAADRIVEADPRADQQGARRDHRLDAVRGGRLHVNLLVKAGSGELSKARRVMRVGLVGLHRLQAQMRLMGVDADNVDAKPLQAAADRRRHPARFDDRPFDRTRFRQGIGDRLRVARNLGLEDPLAVFLNNANLPYSAQHGTIASGKE